MGHFAIPLILIEVGVVAVVGVFAAAIYINTTPQAKEAATQLTTNISEIASQKSQEIKNRLDLITVASVAITYAKIQGIKKVNVPKPLTPDEEKQVEKLTKGIDDFLEQHKDLPEEAERVANGETLEKGRNHVGEAQDFARGLKKGIDVLEKVKNNRVEEAKETIEKAIEHSKKQLEYLRKIRVLPGDEE